MGAAARGTPAPHGPAWSYLGRQDIGWVKDLVRTSDGSALLAATAEGIWRYPLRPN